jgi:hypothetical protein
LRRRLAEGSNPRRGIKILRIEKFKRKKAVKTAVRVEIRDGKEDENWEISLTSPDTVDGDRQIWSNSKKPKENNVEY